MKKNWFLIFFLSLNILVLQAQTDNPPPKNYIIAGLEVEGAKYSDKNSVISLSGLIIGESISIPGQKYANAIKRLWNENLFSDVKIKITEQTAATIKLVIEVTERPRIAEINLTGVAKAQATELKEKINFIRGTILTESKQQSAKRIIRNYYVEKGFFNTKVDIKEEPDKVIRNGVTVSVNIDKGPRTKIKEIAIEGNTAFTDKKFKRNLKKVYEMTWWRFWARSKYVPKTFEEAKDKLLEAYNDGGYRDAKIEFDTVKQAGNKYVQVDIQMYEGPRYYFRNINWAGNYKYNSELLARRLGIAKGDIYSTSKLDKKLSGDPNGGDVSSLYLDDGYLFFNLDPVEVAIDGDSIDLEIRITEGPQATINNIIIEGNNKTSDYVILREIRTAPGQKFDRSAIIRSQREIINLGFFNQEKLGVQPIPDPANGTVDIKYTVEERSSDQLQLQGGWGQRLRDFNGNVIGGGFIGTVQLAFNNFSTKRLLDPKSWRPVPSGDGQKLSLAVQANGTGYQNISLSFLEPWLGGNKPNSLGVNLSYFIFQRFGSSFSQRFRNGIFSSSIDFGRRLKFPDDYFRSNTSLGFKYYDIQNPSITNGGIFNGFEDEPNAFINILTLKQVFDRTSIDAPLFPRSGSIMTFSVEATPPYSLFGNKNYSNLSDSEKFKLLEYHKWEFSSNWFYNIIGNLVLSSKIEAGFLGSYNNQIGTSPFERYYLGGSGLNAGFGLDGRKIIPLRGYDDFALDNENRGYPIYTRFLTELRYPLTLNQQAPIWVLGFLEAGNGFENIRKYNPFDLRRSAGVGVRVMLPMVGLLGLDWGYGFDPLPNTDRTQFHFIIGQQF